MKGKGQGFHYILASVIYHILCTCCLKAIAQGDIHWDLAVGGNYNLDNGISSCTDGQS